MVYHITERFGGPFTWVIAVVALVGVVALVIVGSTEPTAVVVVDAGNRESVDRAAEGGDVVADDLVGADVAVTVTTLGLPYGNVYACAQASGEVTQLRWDGPPTCEGDAQVITWWSHEYPLSSPESTSTTIAVPATATPVTPVPFTTLAEP